MTDIFLSYSHDDEATARRYAELLGRAGFSVWWDTSIRSGDAFDAAIERALEEASAVIVLWSKSSVQSRWVRAEATLAERSKTLVPVMIEACQRPLMFELTQTADLSHWHGEVDNKTWQALLLELRHRITHDRTDDSVAPLSGGGDRGRPQDSALSRPASTKRRIMATIIGALVLFVLAGGSYWGLIHGRSAPAAKPTSSNATPIEPSPDVPRASVAVVPFANHTGEPSKEYFSDGMAEELINSLSHISGLKVPARTSSFAYKGRNVDSRRIAQDLGVAMILEGSVQSAGDRIRVTAELVDGRTGYHLWSNSYERAFTDIFKLQDELIAAITQALQSHIGTTVAAPGIRPPPTTDVLAYQLYLQARSLTGGEESDMRSGVALLDQAIARDPTFARAYAVRATTRALLLYIPNPPANVLVPAERDAQQALSLDPNLGEADTALGIINYFRANWVAAEVSFRKALVEDGNDPFIRIHHAFELAATGHLHQSYQEGLEAYRLAPGDKNAISVMWLLSRYAGLEAEANKYVALLAAIGDRTVLGDPPISEQLRNAGGGAALQLVDSTRADPARKQAAKLALEDVLHRVGSRNLGQYERRTFIASFVKVGAIDQAYELMNQLIGDYEQSGTLVGGSAFAFTWTGDMRSFRKDPRFQSVAARLHLIEYWKAYGAPDECAFSEERLACH